MWHLYRRGIVWWARRTVNGRKERISLETDNRKIAEARLHQRDLAAADPRHHASNKATLGDALGRVIKLRTEQGRAQGTLDMYDEKTAHLARIMGKTTVLAKVTAGKIDEYVSQRRAEGAADPTIAKELTCLRGALRIARRRQEYAFTLEEVMPEGVRSTSKSKETFLEPAQLRALLDELPADRAAHVAFFVALGVRDSEATRAEREDVDLATWVVQVRGTKTDDAAAPVVVPPTGRALLVEALSSCPAEGRLFRPWGNIRRDLHAACDRAGVPRVSPNDLRRTCATWMIGAGTSTLAVSRTLRHRDTRMVELVYGRTSTASLRLLVEAPFAAVPTVCPDPVVLGEAVAAVEGRSTENPAENQCPGAELNRRHADFQGAIFEPESSLIWCVRAAPVSVVCPVVCCGLIPAPSVGSFGELLDLAVTL